MNLFANENAQQGMSSAPLINYGSNAR